ncbi:hypothetical protein Glove_23g91 [Diversispora epigaea]|uniref:Uncharacterized protein n=1 Tax=Diversispora epigaea TaxID=1348612 RepID=A0A397JM31_9GLOM|nr:hypothetical protein Glove_23g91 [Diversispora epigaea]
MRIRIEITVDGLEELVHELDIKLSKEDNECRVNCASFITDFIDPNMVIKGSRESEADDVFYQRQEQQQGIIIIDDDDDDIIKNHKNKFSILKKNAERKINDKETLSFSVSRSK